MATAHPGSLVFVVVLVLQLQWPFNFSQRPLLKNLLQEVN